MRDSLVSKGIITDPHETSCLLCFVPVESVDHLFYQCFRSKIIWDEIRSWLGLVVDDSLVEGLHISVLMRFGPTTNICIDLNFCFG